MIETFSNLPYHQVVRQEIFEPLKMESTFETLHEWRGETKPLQHYAGWFDLTNYNPSSEFADGGFVTTAQDLARFGLALSRGEIFTARAASKHTNGVNSVSALVGILKNVGPASLI